MKKLVDNLKYLKFSDFIAPLFFVIVLPFSIFFKLVNRIKKQELWLICENGTTARDNGYHFYKYIRKNHPHDYCFYVIDKKSSDYSKVKKLGNIIQFKSFKHWLFYLSAKLNISNQKYGNPNQPFFYFLHVSLGLRKNRVFLQHGITKDDSPWLYYKNTKFRYIVCGAKKEYEYIKENFGYPKENVLYTGFPRFDNLQNYKINKNQILIMPTWRNWLGRDVNALGEKINFKATEYYKNWNGLLTEPNFIKYIEDNKITVYFYPHINMHKFINEFKITSSYIKIVDNSNIDIQELLKTSELMITDYSSVYMDFAYMKKPIIYFQFDYEEYRKKQLQNGYFNYKKDGFGPVAKTKEQVLSYIEKKVCYNEKYFERMDAFFELKDNKNSERLYSILLDRK